MNHAVELLRKAWKDTMKRRETLVEQMNIHTRALNELDGQLELIDTELEEYRGAIVGAGGTVNEG